MSTEPGADPDRRPAIRQQLPTQPANPNSSTSARGLTRKQVRSTRQARLSEVRRSFWLPLLSVLLPGLGLVFTRRRRLGVTFALVSLLLLLGLGFAAFSGGLVSGIGRFLSSSGLVVLLTVIVVVGLAWVTGVMLTAQESAQQARRERWGRHTVWSQRLFATVLTLAVAAPAALSAHYVLITRGGLSAMSLDRYLGRGGSTRTLGTGAQAWKDVPRVNLLMIGSDAGTDRVGVRTDSVMVASIDTSSGDTTLIGIPRNLKNVPFPEANPLHAVYPNGFDCSDCLMDAVWQEAEVNRRDLFPADERHPGLDTTREVVQEIVGQPIDYAAVIDLAGFEQLIDAMGGVEINVPTRLPIGGKISGGQVKPGSITGYIEPGLQRLDGYHALWFSRSRVESSDYDRMRRQRCMVNALVSQSNPFSLLQQFPAIMRVAEKNISFDIPQNDLPAFATLVESMQRGNMRSVNLSPPIIDTSRPDYSKIRSLVREGIATPHDESAAKSKGTPSTSAPTSTGSTGPTGSPSSSTTAITDTRANC